MRDDRFGEGSARSFAEIFLRHGARGVIATSGQVGKIESYDFAHRLLFDAEDAAINLPAALRVYRASLASGLPADPGDDPAVQEEAEDVLPRVHVPVLRRPRYRVAHAPAGGGYVNAPGVPVDSVALTPVVSWPREAAPGGRYLVIVDLQLNTGAASWPYPDEEYVVGLMLSGRAHLAVSSLGDTSVVVHRFGGTYGPARFVVSVDGAAATGVRTALWLTLISAGGIPFHTAQSPVTVTREAGPLARPGRACRPRYSTRSKAAETDRLGSDAWSMVAVSVNGRPVLALGTDDGTLRCGSPPVQSR